MKKIITIIIFSICNQLYSQDQWVINTEIGGNLHAGTLSDIEFFDEKLGWAVGFTDNPTHSKIVKTTDGGTIWKNIEVPYSKALRRVEFLNSKTGWAVGDSGIILKSTDGGETWIDMSINPLHHFFCITVIDENNVYITGDSGMYKTVDGGAIWTRLTSLNTPAVQFLDKNNGYYISNPLHIMKTTDGGSSFQDKGAQLGMFFMNFLNPTTGWLFGWDAFGVGVIKKTIDGGNTFNIQYNLGTSIISRSTIIDANNVIAIGDRGAIYKTDDGGVSWDRRNTTYGDLTDVAFNNADNGYIVGTFGIFLQTVTKGVSWFEKYVSSSSYVLNVKFNKTNRNKAAFTAENNIFLSSDGGKKWSKVKLDDDSYWGLAYPSDNSILVSGNNGIKKSKDGGLTWKTNYSNSNKNLIFKLFFLDNVLGWGVGENGLLVKTQDGGESWVQNDFGKTNFINSIYFVNSTLGYVVGDNIAYRSFDGGNNWEEMTGFTTNYLQDVFFFNKYLGWIVSENGTIYRTINSGSTWTKIELPTSNFLYGVYFNSASEGWVYGQNGALYHSLDSGKTWIDKSQMDRHSIFSMDFNIQNQGIFGNSSGDLHNYQCKTEVPTAPEAQFFVKGQQVSFLVASGINLKWYSDSMLLQPVNLTDELYPQDYYVTSSNGSCISNPIKVTAILKTFSSISNSSVKDSLNNLCNSNFFYSNSDKKLHIKNAHLKNKTMNLYNINGQLITSITLNGSDQVELNSLVPGIYIATLSDCNEGYEFAIE